MDCGIEVGLAISEEMVITALDGCPNSSAY
jgi:hypothetical protein